MKNENYLQKDYQFLGLSPKFLFIFFEVQILLVENLKMKIKYSIKIKKKKTIFRYLSKKRI